jgi:dTDP-4-dehydrorhamnose 3,5-epimerase
MIFQPTKIDDVWRVLPEPHVDERGSFARTFCAEEFSAHGLKGNFEQSSLSRNVSSGTLRGMHFQDAPHAEVKFVRCVRGAVVDVVVDIRPDSPTCGQWVAEHLSAENCIGLYIGEGLAHGFQTLEDNSDVLYQITPAFRPGHGRGLRWNDPAFGIEWPLTNPFLSPRDATYPDWAP